MPLASAPLAVYQTPQPENAAPLQIPWYPWDDGQNEWCWAACTQMLISFYNNVLTPQCEIASQFFPTSNCCGNKPGCNFALGSSNIGDIFPLFGKQALPAEGAIEFEDVMSEVNDGRRPVLVGFLWPNNTGHVVIVAGAGENSSGQYLFVNDPDPTIKWGWTQFSYVQAAYGKGSWHWTWKMQP